MPSKQKILNKCLLNDQINLAFLRKKLVLWVRSLHVLNSHESFYRGGKLLHFLFQPLHFNLLIITCFHSHLFYITFVCDFDPSLLWVFFWTHITNINYTKRDNRCWWVLEKSKPLYTVSGNINRHSYYGKQYVNSSKILKLNYYFYLWTYIQKKWNHCLEETFTLSCSL